MLCNLTNFSSKIDQYLRQNRVTLRQIQNGRLESFNIDAILCNLRNLKPKLIKINAILCNLTNFIPFRRTKTYPHQCHLKYVLERI